MKRSLKIVSVLLTAVLILFTCGCGAEITSPGGNGTGENAAGIDPADRLETISQDEYLLYQNVFYNDYASKMDGNKVKKTGILATLHDAFNGVDRYYVWGYYDNTKCCDWQWELKLKDGVELPPDGSLITVEGTFVYDEQALDDYWIRDAKVTTKTRYTGALYDLNMFLMSDTLERVQIINVRRFPDYFKDKTYSAYGRIKTIDSIQDPYYNGSWDIPIVGQNEIPGIGTTVVLTGSVSDGKLNVGTMLSLD